MRKLTPALKKKWIAALRSGEFQQGSQQLCVVDYGLGGEELGKSYCCLGVLGVIAKCDFEDEWDILKAYDDSGNGSPQFLPDGAQNVLAMLNDGSSGKAWSFKKIADFLERVPVAALEKAHVSDGVGCINVAVTKKNVNALLRKYPKKK